MVVGLHGVLVWTLLQTLGQRWVDLELPPLAVDILKPTPQPPPPPPPTLDVPPPALPPPPSYVPLPEIRVRPPPVRPPAITVQRTAPPPAPAVIAAPAPAPAPAPVAAPAAPPSPPPDLSRPAQLEASQCARPAYPRAALRSEATGTTRIRFRVDAGGRVTDARVLQHSGPSREHRLLDRAAVETLGRCRFSAGLDSRGRPVGGFATVEYVWTLQ